MSKEGIFMSKIGFPDYKINDRGDITSFRRRFPVLLKQKRDKDGYCEVQLISEDGSRKFVRVHRMVAMCFIETNPGDNFSDLIVNHIDGNKGNNHVSNLEFVTNRENINHGNIKREYTSKYPGVHFSKKANKWAAETNVCGRKFFIGYYDSEDEAGFNYMNILNHINQENKYSVDAEVYFVNSSIFDRLKKHMSGYTKRQNKEVVCINSLGEETLFISIREMCRELNFDRKCVASCIKSGGKHKGHTFKLK